MGSAVLAKDPETVMQMFELQDKPFFSVIEGKSEILYSHEDDDMNSAKKTLEETLNFIANSGTAAQFTVRIYNDGDKISNKKEYRGTIPFKFTGEATRHTDASGREIIMLNGNNRPYQQSAPVADPAILQILQKLQEQNEQLALLMQQSQEEEEEEEEEPETQEEQIKRKVEEWTAIGSVAIQTLSPLLNGILDRFFPLKNISIMPQNQAMAGTYTDEQLQTAMGAIMQAIGKDEFYRVMIAMGTMATDNPQQLKLLITMVK